MNGCIAGTWRKAGLVAAGLLTSVGCYGYHDLVDPCYPQRYEYAARQDVKASFAPQVHNGHVLDQTIWNYEFEDGTAVLTPGGREHLDYIARRRPCPDTTVYLQVAHDILYDPRASDRYIEERNNLDMHRIQAIQEYLTAETAGRGLVFNVCRHDPAEVGQSAVEANTSVRQLQTSAQGVLVRPSTSGSTSSGGAAGR